MDATLDRLLNNTTEKNVEPSELIIRANNASLPYHTNPLSQHTLAFQHYCRVGGGGGWIVGSGELGMAIGMAIGMGTDCDLLVA